MFTRGTETNLSESEDGPRARYRRQVRAEVQTRAWEQISESGISALSLKAIAAQMGMTAPALYRYYGSRDELLTELILATYQDLAELVEATAEGGETPGRRLADIADALRNWAVANPQRYLLLYGTPVPGYHAPDSATGLAQRIFAPILAGFAAELGLDPANPEVLHRSLTFWTRLHGVLSLELAGHFSGMNFDPNHLYQDEVKTLLSLATGA
jgi:AcrR family transcriptional regulator